MEPILDYTPEEQELVDASMGLRFGNYIVDQISTLILGMGILFLMGDMDSDVAGEGTDWGLNIGSILLHVVILIIFENAFGKSPGKFLTRTRVVTEDGSRPSFMNIVGRNLCRMIPFDGLSFLFNANWHDRFSKTRVVMD